MRFGDERSADESRRSGADEKNLRRRRSQRPRATQDSGARVLENEFLAHDGVLDVLSHDHVVLRDLVPVRLAALLSSPARRRTPPSRCVPPRRTTANFPSPDTPLSTASSLDAKGSSCRT